MIDFDPALRPPGDLDVTWIHGAASSRTADPPLQVHAYDPNTFVLRQNMSVHREAPFLYLLLGNKRALLLDSGATADDGRFPLRATVDALIDRWLISNPRDAYGLVVAHSHAHGDHLAADVQFTDRPDTIVVGSDVASVCAFFGFTDWPGEFVTFDLGGRVLEITGCPGHHDTSIAIYDPWSGFLLTGDTVYPGRLYVADMDAFVASLDRLAAFAAARAVTHLMGGHVEMTNRPGHDYPMGANYQPDEVPLPMAPARLPTVAAAAHTVAGKPGVHVFDDFVIFNGPCRTAVAHHLGRTLIDRVRNGVTARRGARTPR
jgi:hydroxyacylglutathione hydrolase